MIVATASYFAGAEIHASGLAPLRSTVGAPRFALDYRLAGNVPEVAPFGAFGRGLDPAEFRRLYRERLDGLGVERLRALFAEFAATEESPGVVLLCFCRDPAECHRRLFAEWWQDQTGEAVDELGPQQLTLAGG